MFLKKYFKSISVYFILIFAVLVSTLVLWLPFILRIKNWFGFTIADPNFLYIYKHYDGPLYVIPAKTFYQPHLIDLLDLGFLSKYFAAHLPLYPIFIGFFSLVFGYLKAMVFTNILFTIILAMFFYYLLTRLKLSVSPLLLTIIFLFLPRFLVIRSVGAPESLFILMILLSLYSFEKEKYLLAGLFGGLATMTKIPGILLFISYICVLVERLFKTKKFDWKWIGILLVPLGLLGVFGIYQIQYKDFFAYFHTGGVVPMPYPFSVFNFQAKWVGTAWLEDILFYFFIYFLTVYQLKNSRFRSLFYFGLTFLIATIFVQHRDIARYSLPIWPLTCIAFDKFLTSKKIVIIGILLLPTIYLFAWNFLLYNVMPISYWQPFL